jgi:hypothetical protein
MAPRMFDETFDNPTKEKPVSIVRTSYETTVLSRSPERCKVFFEMLQKSESDIDYSELLFASGLLASNDVKLHLQKHWFGKGPDSKGEWFPGDQPIKPQFRKNMMEGIRLSKDKGKPVVVFWVVPTEHVYVTLEETETEIVLFRFTPMPPAPIFGSRSQTP